MAGCASLTGLALVRCLAADTACLPPAHRPLLPVLEAMAERESGFRPLAIRDEATSEGIYPATLADAVRIARERRARGHLLGIGLMQLTSPEALRGLTDEAALDPCLNLRAGAVHLADGIRRYNGSGPAASRYASAVIARVGPAVWQKGWGATVVATTVLSRPAAARSLAIASR